MNRLAFSAASRDTRIILLGNIWGFISRRYCLGAVQL
jgi:hypothetical protein